MDNNFYMNFEESQEYITKRGFDIPWNDCDVFVDERDITRTVANVLKWADATMIKKSSKWIEDEVLEDYGDIIWPNIVKDFQQDMEV